MEAALAEMTLDDVRDVGEDNDFFLEKGESLCVAVVTYN
jgi:hypothetical protein